MEIKESWEGQIGFEIEEAIKAELAKRGGILYRSPQKEDDGSIHLRMFATTEDRDAWLGDPEGNSHLVISDITLPESGGSASASYVLQLLTDTPATIVTTDDKVTLRLRFTSQEYNPVLQQTTDTNEQGTLTIQTRASSSSAWRTVGTMEGLDSMAADSTDYRTIDITPYTNVGSQLVRVAVTGDVTGVSTRYLQFSVVRTTLSLDFASNWSTPVAANSSTMELRYYIRGAVAKTLHIVIDGKRTIERSIGESEYIEAYYSLSVGDTSTDLYQIMTHGIHDIEAWLTVDATGMETEHTRAQMMVLRDGGSSDAQIIVNNISTGIVNREFSRFLDFAVYAPGGAIPLRFVVTNYNGAEKYLDIDMGTPATGQTHTLSNTLEIDSDNQAITAYIHIYSGTEEIADPIAINIDNTEGFLSTADPRLYVNPRQRTNTESAPQTIVNAATGDVVASTWEGFSMNATDGWTVDADGRQCLHIPKGRRLTINEEIFREYLSGNNYRQSMTMEIDFATRNATDPDAVVLRACSYGDDGQPMGFEMRVDEAAMMTKDLRQRADQEVLWQEGVRTHLALNIVHNINNTTDNLIRIFINGIPNREMAWTESDRFATGNNYIVIGSDECDIYIYSLKIFDRALSSTDILNDYIASLPTTEEKRARRDANDIVSGGVINYAKAAEKYNTIVVTGTVPSYGNSKNDVFPCMVSWNIIGDERHSLSTPALMDVSGQGTSSMTYWRWNFTLKAQDGSKFAIADGIPAAKKLVAKKNWASSCQCNKMGATALYNDLHYICVGQTPVQATDGYANTRTAVYQLPFLLFVRETEASEPKFYGLYTMGPGKGDKPTFGVDPDRFPDDLCMEGCDNGEPLVNHWVPWNDQVVEEIEDDEITVMYNGGKQLESDFGEPSNIGYFRDACNFVYSVSPRIEPWEGSVAELQTSTGTDRTKQYWLTKASTGGAAYDLFRYDYVTKTWVSTGTNLASQTGITPSGSDYAAMNTQFINWRLQSFKEGVRDYYEYDELCFEGAIKLLLNAIDNWAKNEYRRLYRYADGKVRIGFLQDDLDSIALFDNVGRLQNRYYDEFFDERDGSPVYNGTNNALWQLFFSACRDDLRAMVKRILSAMATLGGTPEGCIEKYFFAKAQDYFPAVAYNEDARCNYEAAHAQWGKGYTASTAPLTQALGDQSQSLRAWWRKRLIYMSSFAGYGQFDVNGSGSLIFRSAYLAGTRTGANYTFEIVPQMWIYPAAVRGSVLTHGDYAEPQRVKPGESFTLNAGDGDDDTNMQLLGIDCYSKIGEFGDKSITTPIVIKGERLTEFVASAQPMQFRVPSLDISCPNLRRLDLNGVATLTGGLDLSGCLSIESIDLRGTSLSSVTLPQTDSLKELHLPATLTEITLVGLRGLHTLTVDGYGSVSALHISDISLDIAGIVSACLDGASDRLTSITLDNISFDSFEAKYLDLLAAMEYSAVTGRITLADNMTFGLKQRCLAKWGDIDSDYNPLRITYTVRPVESVRIYGGGYFDPIGDYQLSANTDDRNANDITAVEWSLEANDYATINARTGVVTVAKVGTEDDAPAAMVTLTVTKTDGSQLTATKLIGFYYRNARPGDYVFHDGSYGPEYDPDKIVVGICFYTDPLNRKQRLMVALKDDAATGMPWGLHSGTFAGLTLADYPQYSVYDIVDLENIASGGINPDADGYRADPPTGDADGFAVQLPTVASGQLGWIKLAEDMPGGYKAGDLVPYGLSNTLKIIRHRNKILNDSGVNLPVPLASGTQTERISLESLMSDLVAANDNKTTYRQYYYPAASYAYAYEPDVPADLPLADRFKAHHWFLPSAGELARLIWYHLRGYEIGSENAIFADACSKSVFTPLSSVWADKFLTSTESSSTHSWTLLNVGQRGRLEETVKSAYSQPCIRPIASF